MEREKIAKICHDANRAYCQTIEDYSQNPWETAPQWQRDSAIAGVSFRADHPSCGPEIMHASWVAKKLKDGWKYGPVKDSDKKEHPCMVAYGNLPEEQKVKDRLFGAICDALLQSEDHDG